MKTSGRVSAPTRIIQTGEDDVQAQTFIGSSQVLL